MLFDEVYNQYYNELRRFSQQFRISAEVREDLIQETFLRFYLELRKNVVFDNPRAWLFKVLINLFKTRLNSGRREQCDSGDMLKDKESTEDIQERYTVNEKQKIVMNILNKLPERDKSLLLLYNNGFTYAEMAEILRINPNSVGKTLVRAIDNLKEKLKIYYHELFEQN